MSKITVIIPPGPEAVLTRDWAEAELTGMDHEILTEHWKIGAVKASGEYICFLENDCVLSKYYFLNLLDGFTEKPSFRKLAVVAPSIALNDWEEKIYGYRLSNTSVLPAYLRSSSEPYLAQIIYIPGALIRRSALGNLTPREDARDLLVDSVNLSLYLWNNGQRLLIDPNTAYCSTGEGLDQPYEVDHRWQGNTRSLMEMFSRELIG